MYTITYTPEPCVHVTQVFSLDEAITCFQEGKFWLGHVADILVVEFPGRKDISHLTIPSLGHFHRIPENDNDHPHLHL